MRHPYKLHLQSVGRAAITRELIRKPNAVISSPKPLHHVELKDAFFPCLVALDPDSLFPLQL